MAPKARSEITNFYAVQDSNGKTVVFTSSVPITAATALEQLNAQAARQSKATVNGPALRVCFDSASRRLYLPETPTTSDLAQNRLYEAIRVRIEARYGGVSAAPAIHADPASFLRVVRASDFPNAWDFIARITHGQGLDLPVVQANLKQMPETASLCGYRESQQGGYVGTNRGDRVEFKDEGGFLYHAQKTPFILLNLAPEAHMTPAHKERIVLTGFREGLGKEIGEVAVGAISGSEFFSVEFLIYIGWPMEHLCQVIIGNQNRSLKDLLLAGAHLVLAAKHMSSFGYRDITSPPYYYAYKAGPNYPTGQLSNNGVIDELHRSENGFVVIRSPLFLSDDALEGTLGADPNSEVTRARYEPTREAFTFESSPSDITSASPETFRFMCAQGARDSMVGSSSKGMTDRKFSIEVLPPNARQFQRRRISDFPQTADLLKKACAMFKTADGRSAPFQDMEVITGPWQEVAGMAGGYVDRDKILKSGTKIPWEIIPGLPLIPPVILVDVDTCPTAADQANVLVHEYWHYMYYQILHLPEQNYKPPGAENTEENQRRWYQYLTTPTERVSHVQQIKYMLTVGMTKNEIILFFFDNHQPTMSQLPRARKYAEYVDAALDLLNKERENEPFGYNQGNERTQETPGVGGNPSASGNAGLARTGLPSGSGTGQVVPPGPGTR